MMRFTERARLIFIVTLLGLQPIAAERIEFVWPTPSTLWAEGKTAGTFLQQAGSGDPVSGAFGGVRSGGAQFHEGIDVAPVKRDRRGEPTDEIFAAMDGVVRHINTVAGNSRYGRYLVLEHTGITPAVYTLYAHLARIGPGLRVGDQVERGRVLATMGHSSGGYSIPKDRAHLHFEIGLMMTRDFEAWYERKKFGSPNDHGIWNGLNLMGLDPLDFLKGWREGRADNFRDYFAQMKPAVSVRVATLRTPDFIQRYPALLTREMPPGIVAGWEVKFNWTGLPFAWTPLTASEVAGLTSMKPVIVEADGTLLKSQRSKSLAVSRRGGGWSVGKDLEAVLQQMFGVR